MTGQDRIDEIEVELDASFLRLSTIFGSPMASAESQILGKISLQHTRRSQITAIMKPQGYLRIDNCDAGSFHGTLFYM